MLMPFEIAEDRGDKIRELRNANTLLFYDNVDLYLIAPDSNIKNNFYKIPFFGSKNIYLQQLFILLFGVFHAVRISSKSKPDIFLVRGEIPILIGWLIKKIFKIPFIVDLAVIDVNFISEWFLKQEKEGNNYIDINKEGLKSKYSFHSRVANKFNRFGFSEASLFTVEMEYQLKILKDMGLEEKRLFQLLPSLNIEKNYTNMKNEFDAVFIGSLDDSHFRMISPVIDRLRKIISKKPDFKLVIVGGGPYEKVLKEKVKKLGFSKNVIFKGRLPNSEVMDVLKRSRIALSHSTGQKCYEYCALGKPVVVFDGENTRSVLGKAALYSNDWNEYIDNIIFLLENSEKYDELSRNGRKLAESRSIDKIAKDFYKKLEEVLEENRKSKQKNH